jgi:hypothetical protein
MPSIPATRKHSRQFSLRSLMILVTIFCVVLAFPAGHILLGFVLVWLIVGAVILSILTSLRRPLYRILSGEKRAS